MNLSVQLVRGFAALAMCTAISAYALTQPVAAPEGQEVAAAHSRLTIKAVRESDDPPHYQVASVRVGEPIAVPNDLARRVVLRVHVSEIHGSS